MVNFYVPSGLSYSNSYFFFKHDALSQTLKCRKLLSTDTWQIVVASYTTEEGFFIYSKLQNHLGIQKGGKLVFLHLLKHRYIPPLKSTVTRHVQYLPLFCFSILS